VNSNEVADVVGQAIAVSEVDKSHNAGRSIAVRTNVRIGGAKLGRLALVIGRRKDGTYLVRFACRGGWMRHGATITADQVESIATKAEVDGRPISY
jgi:hypothetical protein